MEKSKDFTCKSCDCQTSQGNRFHKLCTKCNERRLASKKGKPRSIKVYRKKPTGEREMFLEIWDERPHICTNPKCKKPLDENPKVHYFAHIKPKGKYPELRLVKSNVRLLCMECHHELDFGKGL